MHLKKAFTLIELLVVIAIIAILAAILFPVFAQAKTAAKAVADLSNIKQIGTAMVMYTNDYDDRYSFGIPHDWSGDPGWGSHSLSWTYNLQPYSKSLALFRSPLETSSKMGATWAGTPVSYALNGFTVPNAAAAANMDPTVVAPDDWEGRCFKDAFTNTQDCTLRGFGAPYSQITGEAGGGELNTASLTSSQVTKPSESIVIATKFNGDAIKWSGGTGNQIDFQCGGIFEAVPTTDGSRTYDLDWCGGAQIPNGLRDVDNKTPQGRYGAVSQTKQGQSNFSMGDTHAKSLQIASTNPNPDKDPAKNMWDALRP